MHCCVVVEEGLHKLWQGVTPAIYRHIGKSDEQVSFEDAI